MQVSFFVMSRQRLNYVRLYPYDIPTYEEIFMALSEHIETLKQKHRDLDIEISRLLSSPSSTDREVSLLKRRKLQLRDQIARLESGDGEAA